MSDSDLMEPVEAIDDPLAMTPEELKAEAAKIVDGIYFDLPEDIYHAVERLSNSGIQRLAVSPGTFWADSWLNPEPPQLTEAQQKARNNAKITGRAYHCARLEPDQFEQRYCRSLEKSEMPEGTLTSDSAIKAQLKAKGATQTIGDETVLDRAHRLIAEGFDGTIWQIEQAAWEQSRNGRIALPGIIYDDILRDQKRLLGNGPVAQLFEDGQSEVSIFWTDEHGIPMKARLDRLTPTKTLDFKTFSNSAGKVLDKAIADAVQYNRYYMQPVIYRDAIEAVRSQGLEIQGEATDDQRGLIARIRIAPDPTQFWFVFQEKGGVPNLLAKRFKFHSIDAYRETEVEAMVEEERQAEIKDKLGTRTQISVLAMAEIRNAKRQFLLYSQIYPPGVPWAPAEPLGTLDDLDFNSGWLEGKWR